VQLQSGGLPLLSELEKWGKIFSTHFLQTSVKYLGILLWPPMSQQLANGWTSHVDAGSGNTYYSKGETTTWEMPAEAA
jgi:hypothetical protein